MSSKRRSPRKSGKRSKRRSPRKSGKRSKRRSPRKSNKHSKRQTPKIDRVSHNTRKARDVAMKKGYYPKPCFLTNTNEYFICGKNASLSCVNLRSAKSKALKKGHKKVVDKAVRQMKIKGC